MRIKYLLLCLLLTAHCGLATATVRYVSKTGSSTPPYTSWATASDSIQKCINICQNGDTVYVANGVYNESIYVDKTIHLWGSSADSTVLDGRGTPTNYVCHFFQNNSSFKNFRVTSPGYDKIGIYSWKTKLHAENCIIDSIRIAIIISNSSPIIEKFIIKNVKNWILHEECPNDTCNGIYRNNIILSNNASETPVEFGFGGSPTFTNNIVIEEGNNIMGINGTFLRGVVIKNNLISGFKDNSIQLGSIRIDSGIVIDNNLLFTYSSGVQNGGINIGTGGLKARIRNNIFGSTVQGIYGFNEPVRSDYNLFWRVNKLTLGTAYLGDSNIVADPMFVKDTIPASMMNYDFHLQRYSPAIDKGDPSILDKNGSRSDIGMYGGPSGETYKYLDLPPKTPRNFTYSFDTTQTLLTLRWDTNYESDFSNYKIYRDTVSGFTPSMINLVSQPDTSFITEDISEFTTNKIYYLVTSIDNQNNESQPSEEIAITITDINDPNVEIIRDYILYQNYPNPFNPSTTIGYGIKERSYVKLMVYDIKGELISVLVNKEQNAGYYEVEFNVKVGSLQSTVSKINNLASGIYLYRIEVIGEGNIPVHSDMKKMLIIK